MFLLKLLRTNQNIYRLYQVPNILAQCIVRALSSNFLKNDERVTNIRKVNDKFYSVLGGKWNTCVSTAKYLTKII